MYSLTLSFFLFQGHFWSHSSSCCLWLAFHWCTWSCPLVSLPALVWSPSGKHLLCSKVCTVCSIISVKPYRLCYPTWAISAPGGPFLNWWISVLCLSLSTVGLFVVKFYHWSLSWKLLKLAVRVVALAGALISFHSCCSSNYYHY